MRQRLARSLGVLLFAASLAAAACPICISGTLLTTAQQVAYAERAVLALPSADGTQFRIVAVIKGRAEIVRMQRGAASLTATWPWVVAFAFGLLHGFGFATCARRLDDRTIRDELVRIAEYAPARGP